VIVMERRIDIDRARREAKALLRAARAGDPAALERLRPDRQPCLADAQHAVARSLGERSWPALVRRVDALGRGLRDAARAGRAQDVYGLLESGAPPNARDPDSGATALHLAAAHGRLDAVDSLVSWHPVDRQARDAAGRTALGACVEGTADPAVARVLVSVGLEPEPWMPEWVGQPRDRGRLPMRFAQAAWTADVARLRIIAGSPLAEARPVGDGFAVVTGQFDNTRNGVVCSRLPEPDTDAAVESALAWLSSRRLPGQWLVAAVTEPPDLRSYLEHAGCRPERSAVHMAGQLADLDLSPRPEPAGLEIAAIRDEFGLAEAMDDPDDARLWASLGLGDTAPLRHYAARLDGRPVGVVTLLVDRASVAVLDAAVTASQRRRGIGTALVLHALREGAGAGASVATIAPTPATVPFYEALGLDLERYPPERAYYTPG
jgi:GNAT superfamily N-acetyltransferase